MTVKKRLAHSNIIMILAPVLMTFVMLLSGAGVFIYKLESLYLPSLGLTLEELHIVMDRYESVFGTFEMNLYIYVGAVAAVVIATIILANIYLTQYISRHITEPLDELVRGVDRIRGGNLESPICYREDDEFRPACDAVDLMAARLKESMEKSQEEQQRRKEMLAGMSHDLRSPLTSIRAYTEALIDGAAKTPEAQMKYLGIIRAKEAEIEEMTEQLFSFSKLELSDYPVHTEKLNVKTEIEQITQRAGIDHLSADTSGVRPETVTADRALLERIVLNVLENSRKYRVGPTAHVDISSLKTADGVEIRFEDDGPGVSEELLPKLFEPFFRADPARKNPSGGSGLGLAIVRRSAGQMHGTVRAEKSRLGGLAVVLTLPAAEQKEENP
jgi:signal transduction histidine kinase